LDLKEERIKMQARKDDIAIEENKQIVQNQNLPMIPKPFKGKY
jgi:hypothetical protein